VVELANGRFYPVRVEQNELVIDSLSRLTTRFEVIPLAVGPHLHLPQVERGFSRREDAIAYCLRRSEEWPLLYECNTRATESELFPERNAWYRAEIERIVRAHDLFASRRDPISLSVYSTSVSAWVSLSLGGKYQSLHIEAPTMDEAWKALYQCVYKQVAADSGLREVHPERNAWYREVIHEKTGNPPFTSAETLPVICRVHLPDGSLCSAAGKTVDEALEELCEQVYERMGQNEEPPEPALLTSMGR